MGVTLTLESSSLSAVLLLPLFGTNNQSRFVTYSDFNTVLSVQVDDGCLSVPSSFSTFLTSPSITHCTLQSNISTVTNNSTMHNATHHANVSTSIPSVVHYNRSSGLLMSSLLALSSGDMRNGSILFGISMNSTSFTDFAKRRNQVNALPLSSPLPQGYPGQSSTYFHHYCFVF